MTLTARPHVFLVVHAVHDRGGMERACAELIRRAHPEFRFTVVAVELAPELRPFCGWIRVPAPRRPMPLRFLAFFVFGGVLLATRHPDLVHTVGAIVPNRVDVAWIQFCHAGYRAAGNRRSREEMGPLRWVSLAVGQRLALAAERYCFRPGRVRTFAAVSQGVARELREHYPGVVVAHTPNGVDTKRYRPDAERRRLLRAEQRVDDGDIVLLFVGGDWAHKGLAIAIEALSFAVKRQVQALLWVVGAGRADSYRVLAERLAVGERVQFFGNRPDTERFYSAADLFVLPTPYETFSIVAHEAAASGLPVIAPRVSGIAELVGKDEAGMVVPRTAEGVGAAVVALARDPHRRKRLGECGRERARAFTWDRTVTSIAEVYREHVGKGRVAHRDGSGG